MLSAQYLPKPFPPDDNTWPTTRREPGTHGAPYVCSYTATYSYDTANASRKRPIHWTQARRWRGLASLNCSAVFARNGEAIHPYHAATRKTEMTEESKLLCALKFSAIVSLNFSSGMLHHHPSAIGNSPSLEGSAILAQDVISHWSNK